jgi:hypothetical protein
MSNSSAAGALEKRRNRRTDPPTKRVTAIEICNAVLNVTTPPETRDLAQRLLTYEANAGKTSEPVESATLRVYEKLRHGLGEFAGVAGFQSLASRALALARLEAPSLSAARVTADGSLRGLGALEHQIDNDKDRAGAYPAGEGGMILITRLLGLLLIFLGEALTLSLLRVSWPGAALDGSNSENGRKA